MRYSTATNRSQQAYDADKARRTKAQNEAAKANPEAALSQEDLKALSLTEVRAMIQKLSFNYGALEQGNLKKLCRYRDYLIKKGLERWVV